MELTLSSFFTQTSPTSLIEIFKGLFTRWGGLSLSYRPLLFGGVWDVRDFTSFGRSSRLELSSKKLFLEISQNSQENTCARVSF